MSYRFGSNLIQAGRAVGAKRAQLCLIILDQISSKQAEPLGQSEQLVERAYVRPYTPYVHPRPQVLKIVVIVMILVVMPVLYA